MSRIQPDSSEDRKNKIDLILRYEELLQRRKLLLSSLEKNVHDLEVFAYLIERAYNGNRFEKRHNGLTIDRTLGSFDPGCLDDYHEIKKKAVECEKIYFELFTLRQKLKLHEVDEGLNGDD